MILESDKKEDSSHTAKGLQIGTIILMVSWQYLSKALKLMLKQFLF